MFERHITDLALINLPVVLVEAATVEAESNTEYHSSRDYVLNIPDSLTDVRVGDRIVVFQAKNTATIRCAGKEYTLTASEGFGGRTIFEWSQIDSNGLWLEIKDLSYMDEVSKTNNYVGDYEEDHAKKHITIDTKLTDLAKVEATCKADSKAKVDAHIATHNSDVKTINDSITSTATTANNNLSNAITAQNSARATLKTDLTALHKPAIHNVSSNVTVYDTWFQSRQRMLIQVGGGAPVITLNDNLMNKKGRVIHICCHGGAVGREVSIKVTGNSKILSHPDFVSTELKQAGSIATLSIMMGNDGHFYIIGGNGRWVSNTAAKPIFEAYL